jgi:hypothetical protein
MIGWFLFEPYNEARLTMRYEMFETKLTSNSIQSILFSISPKIFNITINFSSITLSFASIMLLTYFTACFLLTIKRLGEKISIRNAEKIRKSLKYYNVTGLKFIIFISFLMIIFSFILFSFSFKYFFLILLPLLIYSLIWYYKLTFKNPKLVSKPEEIFKLSKFIFLFFVFIILSLLVILI